MFKINRKVEYVLIALRHMSQKNPGELTTAKEICDAYGAPFDPTSRGLQILAQNGILKAEHGAHGGYQIQKDLARVSFGDLTDLIVGPIQIANCFHGDYSQCEINSVCNVISPMLNLNEKMVNLFKTITVKELIESRNTAERTIRTKPKEEVHA